MQSLGQWIDRNYPTEIGGIGGQYRLGIRSFGQPFRIRMVNFTLVTELVDLTAENPTPANLPGTLHPDGVGMEPLTGNSAGIVP